MTGDDFIKFLRFILCVKQYGFIFIITDIRFSILLYVVEKHLSAILISTRLRV